MVKTDPQGPTLSVCVPTYNRLASVKTLVEKLLACPDARLEVVVLDNASNDDTFASLKTITDPRLALHSNPSNCGGLYNALNVLAKARGKFSVLVLDKDNVHTEWLPGFIDFLDRTTSLAAGYCEYRCMEPVESIILQPGMQSIRRIAYRCHHPTGFFFHTSSLREINFTERFGSVETVGHFPFEYIFAELLLQRPGAIYQRPLFSPEPAEQSVAFKSISTNAAREEAYFSPTGRLKTAISFARHIETLHLPPNDLRLLTVESFINGLLAATLGYRATMADVSVCSHYHTNPRDVSHGEFLRIASKFYHSFHRDFIASNSSGAFKSGLQFDAQLFLSVTKRLIRKIGRKWNAQRSQVRHG